MQILSSGMDLTSMMAGGQEDRNRNEETKENDPDTVTVRRLLTSIFSRGQHERSEELEGLAGQRRERSGGLFFCH